MIQNSVLGDSFCILCFIRQDGVLSTVLVAFYVDDITVNPWNCSYVLQVGCLYFYSLYLVLYLSCIWVSLILPGHSLCPCWRLRKTVRGSHEYTADFSHGFWYSVPDTTCVRLQLAEKIVNAILTVINVFINLSAICFCTSLEKCVKYVAFILARPSRGGKD